MNMNDCRKNSVTFLIVSLSEYKYRVRNMHKIVTKSVNMNLIRRAGALGDNNQTQLVANNSPKVQAETMATIQSYRLKKKGCSRSCE